MNEIQSPGVPYICGRLPPVMYNLQHLIDIYTPYDSLTIE